MQRNHPCGIFDIPLLRNERSSSKFLTNGTEFMKLKYAEMVQSSRILQCKYKKNGVLNEQTKICILISLISTDIMILRK